MKVRSTSGNVALVLFRVLSVYALIRGIDNLSYNLLVSHSSEKYPYERLVQLIGSAVVMLICGIVLWIVAPMISSWVSRDSAIEGESPISLTEGIAQTLFSAVGLFVFVDTIPLATYQIGHSILLLSAHFDSSWVLAENAIVLGTSIIKLVLGACLVVGSGKVVKMLK